MTTVVQECINYVQAQILATMPTIKHAPQYPSSHLIETPTAQTWADNIIFDNSASNAMTFFDMHIDILRKNEPLEDAFKWLEGIPEAVAAIFATDPTLGGYAATYGTITCNIKEAPALGVTLIGYHIIISRIKILR